MGGIMRDGSGLWRVVAVGAVSVDGAALNRDLYAAAVVVGGGGGGGDDAAGEVRFATAALRRPGSSWTRADSAVRPSRRREYTSSCRPRRCAGPLRKFAMTG